MGVAELASLSHEPNPGQELLAELLRCGHRVHVSAHGNSMHPTIKHGERVIVTPLASTPVRRGDIVYLQRGDAGYVLHRVLRTFTDGRIQTRGDANWRLDDAVAPQAVLGRVLQTSDASSRSRSQPRLQLQLSALANAIRCTKRLAASWCGYQHERLTQRLTNVAAKRQARERPGTREP
ncbi:MAG: hypothetical protein ACI9DC_000145 [Gammaproteobacteria bacterium]